MWTAREEPGPATADVTRAVHGPNWLLQSTTADGLVRLHNHGSEHLPPPGDPDQDDPYYARLAYSTATGPVPYGAAPDNHFGLLSGGDRVSLRTRLEPLGAGDGWAASRHHARVVGEERPDEVRITGLVLAHGAAEVRVHLVAGAAPGHPVRQTGWAVPDDGPRSELLPLHGLLTADPLPAAATAFSGRAIAPALTGETTGGAAGDLFVCLARLTAEPDPAPLETLARVDVAPADGGYEVRVAWWDGAACRAHLSEQALRIAPAIPAPVSRS
ncbi:LigA protein [Streptomyces himastatinicus ATCC 53653]|uniref:LigA protein n=1 Tax=Streptomyces himastatinicus ATCC 53653 TaxID=457427 RepID=D9WN01_9ACTN|nr:LigA protein [Streptomyces himastatinicus ATCC 53653]